LKLSEMNFLFAALPIPVLDTNLYIVYGTRIVKCVEAHQDFFCICGLLARTREPHRSTEGDQVRRDRETRAPPLETPDTEILQEALWKVWTLYPGVSNAY
jgi:hypothetical protein